MAKSNQADGFQSMQPSDWYEEKVKFPCLLQPKIDGVASYNRHGNLLGRSLKPHENKKVTQEWSHPGMHGFCGEMISGFNPTSADLCRITSGDLRRHNEQNAKIHWFLFDYCTDETKDLPYYDRMEKLVDVFRIALTANTDKELCNLLNHCVVIPTYTVENMQELVELEAKFLNEGYEGVILRDPDAPFKYGRCGKTFMGSWRVKRFIDAEILVESIEEGRSNQNEATVNERGRTERSTHAENMLPNGQIGSMSGSLLADVVDPQTKQVLITKGTVVKVSPGEMPVDQRKHLFLHQDEILGKIAKFKLFPKGMKDLPRFPVWTSFRNENDL